MEGGNNIDNVSEETLAEGVSKMLQSAKTLSNDDKSQLTNMLTEVAQNHEVIETIDITNAELKQYIEHGVERLESNDVSPSEVSEAVNNATKMVSDLEVQSNIRKSIPKELVDRFKNLSTVKKVLTGSTIAATGVMLAPAVLVVAAPVALVALTFVLLSLGGMAIGKGAIATGKGAVIAGKGIAHGAQVTGKAIASGTHKVKESAEKVSKAATHSVKNVADTLPGRITNIEQFLNKINKIEKDEHSKVKKESKIKYDFLKKYIVNDQNAIDNDKVEALKWTVHEIISHDDAKNLIDQVDVLLDKGKSTFGTDKNDKIDDYKKFEEGLNNVISQTNTQKVDMGDAFDDKLKKIKQEKVDQKANSPLNQTKSKVSSTVETVQSKFNEVPDSNIDNPNVQEQSTERSKG